MSLLSSAETSTLPKLLVRNARQHGDEPAMREKDRGIWRTLSWRQAREFLRDLSLGLGALGFGRGDKLSVVGDNRPALYLAQLAAQARGGIAIPVYQDAIATELVYVLNHAEVVVIVAEDQEQVDKILSLKSDLPKLRWILYEDPRGMSGYDDPMLKPLAEVLEIGRKKGAAGETEFEHELALGMADDIAMIAYTSGTTGRPKGALLSHRNVIATAENYIKGERVERGDNWLAFLPMAWVGDAMYSLGVAIVAGATINCPESPETVQRDLRELGPTIILAPPRIWENLLTQVQVRAADSTPLKRRIFDHFRSVAEQRELLLQDGKPIPSGLKAAYALGEILVYAPLRDLLGFGKARWAVTGGAPLGPDTFRFFRSIGINLKQVYGQTEASALVAFQRDAHVDPNTVGEPVPGLEMRIADDGELQVRGPGVFVGYYKQDEATAETMTADGWLKTGDAAQIDPQGQLAIIDRAKDVGRLADGTPFAPQYIENKLKFSPFIREAIAFGNGRTFVTAMVAIDMQTVGNWAERRNIAYTSFADLARKPEVAALITEEVRKINATLPEATRARRVLLLTKELDADDNELTRTRKVRRAYVAQKYAPVIDAFYSDSGSVEVTMEVTFEDGRKTTLADTIAIHYVGHAARPRAAA
ncbi:MAG: AMP-binding protein [Hyphomicrobiaceae bacterium]|nr:AMP-binding protein [Hyphomicrobiaceae bacterium]